MSDKGSVSCVIIILLFNTIIGITQIWWTDNNLDWLLTLIKDQPVDVPFWLSALTSIALGSAVLLFNVIIALFRLVV